MTEFDRKPSIEELKKIVNSPIQISGEYNLKPTVEIAIPERTLEEDFDVTLSLNASGAYTDELRVHTGLKTKRSRLKFIKDTFRYDDARLASYLGITKNQIERKDLRGRRKKEKNRFEERFNGLFTLSSILEKNFKGYIGAVIDRRVALETPNGKLSEMSVNMAVEKGFINIAAAIALETLRINQENMDNQEIKFSDQA